MGGSVFLPAAEGRLGRGLRWSLGGALFLVGTFAASIVLAPTHMTYEIEGGRLRVETRVGLWPDHRELALADVTRAEAGTVRLRARIAGTGMPGHCSGSFDTEPFGRAWVATDCGRRVVAIDARGQDRTWLLSPAEPGAFLEALQARSDGSFAPSPGGARGPLWRVMQVLVGTLPLLLVAVFFLGPRRLRYRIVGRTLRIDKLLGSRTVPLPDVVARRVRPGKVRRVFGSALPGYYGGRFTVDGVPTQVFASRVDEGVLLEGGGVRYFVTPADVDAFVATIQRAGGPLP